MARRYNDEELEQLKRNVSITRLCSERGIELKPHGTRDLIGKCPFHDDEKPSFIVTPGKNLFHCMGCDAAGSVIDLVMKLDGLTLREAIDQLITTTGHVSRGTPPAEKKKPAIPGERAAALMERTLSVYEKNFAEQPDARQYLEGRGITDAALFSRFRVGYSTGTLSEMLPGNGGVRAELNAIGVLLDPIGKAKTPTRERFAGCVVFPVFDVEGQLTTIYGRHIDNPKSTIGNPKSKHLFLPGRSTGLWNVQAVKSHPAVILTESVIDALSVMVAGFPNVIAVQGTNGVKDADIETLRRHGVAHVTLLLDGDDAGGRAVGKLRPRLEAAGLAVTVKALPADHDPNSYLQEHGAEALARILSDAEPADPSQPACLPYGPGAGEQRAEATQVPPNSSPPCPRALEAGRPGGESSLVFTYGLRTYRVLGLDKGNHKLRATVRAEFAGKLHVDTLDLYSARSRRMLAQDLCRIFDEAPETIEGDLTRLLTACEKAASASAQGSGGQGKEKPVTITDADRREAEAFGKSPTLFDDILADCEKRGLMGEHNNVLLLYVSMTSRKRETPLSVLILSSSGAGKTALQDAVLAFCPPEDLVKLTALSGKALFYKDRLSLKHKVLALEEGDGATEAMYAIRNLISAGELISESTIKDLSTGRLTTMENHVEGPSAVSFTTTHPDVDPETKSRFWVTSIDESREQTRAILAFQRRQHLSDGLITSPEIEAILRKHRNFQRLLQPIAVKNPYAAQLAYGDDRLQGRRDQPKYLNLIKAVAFLRQMVKPVKYENRNGTAVPFIEVDRDDIRMANRLTHAILGRSLDEMSRPGNDLLRFLDDMARHRLDQLRKENPETKMNTTDLSFSRRDIREFTGWTNTRLHIHLKELVEMEYIIIEAGRNGLPYRYRLAWEGQGKDGSRFMLGLIDPETLA